MSTALALALASLPAATAGCSFSISAPDPKRPRHQLPKCDTGRGVMVLDVAFGLLSSSIALALLANDEAGAAVVPGSLGALAFVAVARGNRAANACERALDDYQQYVKGLAGRDDRQPRRPRVVTGTAPAPAVAAPAAAPVARPAPAAPAPAARPAPAGTLPAKAPASAPAAKPAPAPAAPAPAPAPAAPAPGARPAATKPAPPPAPGAWDEFWRELP